MSATSKIGASILVINDHTFAQQADGDYVDLRPDKDLFTMKIGKDGNTIYVENKPGAAVPLTVRLMLGSADASFMMGLLQQAKDDFINAPLLTGTLQIPFNDGSSSVKAVQVAFSGGVFKRMPAFKSNAEGDAAQGVTVFEMEVKIDSQMIV